MLIESHRHTVADLELWREYEATDKLLGERIVASKQIVRAAETIRQFTERGPCYAATSWGKDSVVLLHLLWRFAPHVPVVNLRVDPTRNPYCDAVRDAFLARYLLPYHEEPVDYHGCGEWFTEWWDDATYRRWDAAWKRVGKQFGDRYFSGVRAAESGMRCLRMRHFGLATERTCAPMGWMSTPAVFGYLAHYDLPTHPNYAMLGGGRYERDKLRVSEIGDMGGATRGRREHEREYYGDILRRLESQR